MLFNMKRIVLILVISILMPSIAFSAENAASQDAYPDLLAQVQQEDKTDTDVDLLSDDPFVPEPVYVLGDPIFEDDFTFNDPAFTIKDPLEPMNRVFFTFNDKLYFWVLKPVNKGYSAILPTDVRLCIGNFFTNLASPIRFINNLLQGEGKDAGIVLGRFVINSTLGILGLGDPAYVDFDLEPQQADFGQTLGKWGFGEGIYLLWPGLGPSSVRDTFGFAGDYFMHPYPYLSEDFVRDIIYYTVRQINALSLSPDVYEELIRISVDPYVASRQAYYEYRRSIISQ